MAEGISGWRNFWDLTDPEDAARVLTVWYGAAAADAAADCAAMALADRRDADHRFWMTVAASISNTDYESRKADRC